MDIRGWAQSGIGSIGANLKKKFVLISKKFFSLEAAKPRNVVRCYFWIIFFIFGFQHGPGHMKKKSVFMSGPTGLDLVGFSV